MKRKITAIVQARMTSTRLPGKVMKKVLGKPLLNYLSQRLQSAANIDDIILATTENPEDNSIAEQGKKLGLRIFRGSEHNVLDRFYRAAIVYQADHIMRITADCPLIDPHFLDLLIEYYTTDRFDYVSNCAKPTLPDGLDAEIFTFQALEYAHQRAHRLSCLEHVTPYIRNHPDIFTIGSWSYTKNLSHLRWTVDEPDDFLFVQQVIESLYPINPHFRTDDILNLLYQRSELAQINNHIHRNEGYVKSLKMDIKGKE